MNGGRTELWPRRVLEALQESWVHDSSMVFSSIWRSYGIYPPSSPHLTSHLIQRILLILSISLITCSNYMHFLIPFMDLRNWSNKIYHQKRLIILNKTSSTICLRYLKRVTLKLLRMRRLRLHNQANIFSIFLSLSMNPRLIKYISFFQNACMPKYISLYYLT